MSNQLVQLTREWMEANPEKVFNRAQLITGNDEHGNEIVFNYGEGGSYYDVQRECAVARSYIKEFVMPNIVIVRFGNFSMSRAEWVAEGCPLELSKAQEKQICERLAV